MKLFFCIKTCFTFCSICLVIPTTDFGEFQNDHQKTSERVDQTNDPQIFNDRYGLSDPNAPNETLKRWFFTSIAYGRTEFNKAEHKLQTLENGVLDCADFICNAELRNAIDELGNIQWLRISICWEDADQVEWLSSNIQLRGLSLLCYWNPDLEKMNILKDEDVFFEKLTVDFSRLSSLASLEWFQFYVRPWRVKVETIKEKLNEIPEWLNEVPEWPNIRNTPTGRVVNWGAYRAGDWFNFEGILNSLPSLPNLQVLSFSGIHLTKNLVKYANFPKLKTLGVNYLDKPLSWFKWIPNRAPNLENLLISGYESEEPLCMEKAKEISKLKSLRYIWFGPWYFRHGVRSFLDEHLPNCDFDFSS